jgi:hypothetical protein
LGVASLVVLTGCIGKGTVRMRHPGVSNPIFLGDRMHIGDEERRFTLAEETERYRGKSTNMWMWSVLPILGESVDDERIEADARQARKRLGITSYRAVNIQAFEVYSQSVFMFFLLATGSSIDFRGELVEVIPAPESFDDDTVEVGE